MTGKGKNMEKHKITYGLFYDNHTHMENPDVGRDFDAEYFTDQLLRCGVNYLGFHARCNTGMSYYDTKIGTKHPSLKYDLFGELAKDKFPPNIKKFLKVTF